MKRILCGKTSGLDSGANFEGSGVGCICNGPVAVANSHNAGPAYCVGYCGSAGSVTKTANMNLAKIS